MPIEPVFSPLHQGLSVSSTHLSLLHLFCCLKSHKARLQTFIAKSSLLSEPHDVFHPEHEKLLTSERKLLVLINQLQIVIDGFEELMIDTGSSQYLAAALDPSDYHTDDWPYFEDSETEETESEEEE